METIDRPIVVFAFDERCAATRLLTRGQLIRIITVATLIHTDTTECVKS